MIDFGCPEQLGCHVYIKPDSDPEVNKRYVLQFVREKDGATAELAVPERVFVSNKGFSWSDIVALKGYSRYSYASICDVIALDRGLLKAGVTDIHVDSDGVTTKEYSQTGLKRLEFK